VVAMWSRTALREEVLEALRVLARHGATAIAGAHLMDEARAEGAKARAATGRMAALLDASRSGVIMFDHERHVTYVNGAFRRIFGIGDAPVVQRTRNELEVRLRVLLCKGKQSGVLAAEVDQAAGDTELWIQIPGEPKPRVLRRYAAPVSAAGETLGWMEVFDDVTQAHELDQMKSEFISTVSHELRSPLTSIKGALALMLDGKLDEESHELVAVSKRNADRLVRLVNDILDIEKIEAGKVTFNLKPTRLMDVIERSLEMNCAFAQGRNIELRLAQGVPDALVFGDEDRLIQVLTNLISNAVKVSPRGEQVSILVTRRGGMFRTWVQDRGPGIPEEFRSRIFQKFAQAERRDNSSTRKGTGLGLTIAKALVETMGGRIGFETEIGRGTSFFFDLTEDTREKRIG